MVSQVENALNDRRALVDLLDNPLSDQLVHGRNSDDDRRLVRDHVTVTIPNRFLRERLDGSVSDGDSGKVEGHLDEELEDVGEGEEGEEDVIWPELGLQELLGPGN